MSKPKPKYWTTTVEAEKTVREIQEKLVQYGVRAVMVEYADRRPVALTFKVEMYVQDRPLEVPVKLAPKTEMIFDRLQGARAAAWSRRDNEDRDWLQAERVAWRQLKDWLILSLEMTELGIRDISDIFFGDIVVAEGVRFADAFYEEPNRFLNPPEVRQLVADVEYEIED